MNRLVISVFLLVVSVGSIQGMKVTKGVDLALAQENITSDTNRVNDLLEKSGRYFFTKPDSSLFFARQALDLAHQLNFTKAEIVALQVQGEAQRFFGDYAKSLDCQFQALELSRSSKQVPLEAMSLGFIGFNYSELGEYRQALQYLFSANAIFERRRLTIRT